MPTLFDAHLVALYSQHSIQSQDLLKICDLAKTEDMIANLETYSFDNFLGLTIHLFVTTQSQHTREQLALQLPKFGSAVVSPLIKILCRLQMQKDVYALTQKSLNNIELYPLIIGLSQLLDHEVDNTLRAIAVQQLMQLIEASNQSVLSVLPRLVSQRTWRILKLQLLAKTPYPRFNLGDCDRSFSSQTNSTLNQEKQPHIQQIQNHSTEKLNLCGAK